jgi:hypothetical protein
MYCDGITDSTGSMRALTESEVALVGGGINWGKIVDAVVEVASAISPTANAVLMGVAAACAGAS